MVSTLVAECTRTHSATWVQSAVALLVDNRLGHASRGNIDHDGALEDVGRDEHHENVIQEEEHQQDRCHLKERGDNVCDDLASILSLALTHPQRGQLEHRQEHTAHAYSKHILRNPSHRPEATDRQGGVIIHNFTAGCV